MSPEQLNELDGILAEFKAYHADLLFLKECDGPKHCPGARAIQRLEVFIGSARLESGFDDPQNAELSSGREKL